MVIRRLKALEARGTLRLLPEGSITGREHSSPLKYTLLGKPSPAPTSISGVVFFVKDMTDCWVPGTGGSFLGLSPLLSARSSEPVNNVIVTPIKQSYSCCPSACEFTKQMPI